MRPIISSVLVLMICSQELFARDIVFRADTLIHEQGSQKTHAKGNVVVETDEGTLVADEMHWDGQKGEISGHGQVTLETPQFVVKADHFVYSPKSYTGEFKNFWFQQKDITLAGKKLIRLDKDRFRVQEGVYSPCLGACKDWYVYGKKVDVTIEEYVWITSAWLYARGMPIFFAPVLAFPAKRKRQSGFLMPKYAHWYPVGGVVEVPYFWAMSPHMDMTFVPRAFLDRGPGLGVEHRYMASPTWTGTTIGDLVYETETRQWFFGLRTKHFAFFPDVPLTVANVGFVVSDQKFFEDYFHRDTARGVSGLPLILGAHHGPAGLDISIRAMHIQDVLARTVIVSHTASFVFPWIAFQTDIGKLGRYGGFSLEGRMLYTDRWQGTRFDEIPPPESITVDPNGKIISAVDPIAGLDANDVIVGVFHAGVVPRLHLAIPLAKIWMWDVEGVAPLRYYALPEEEYALFAAPEMMHRVSARLERIYGAENDVERFRHVITPSVAHGYRPYVWREGLTSFFAPPTSGLDPEDQIEEDHFVEFALYQTVVRKLHGQYGVVAAWNVRWTFHTDYGLVRPREQATLGPLLSDLLVYFGQIQMHVHVESLVAEAFRTRLWATWWMRPWEWMVVSGSLVLDQIVQEPKETQALIGTISLLKLFGVMTLESTVKYSLVEGRVEEQTHGIYFEPASRCWMLGVSLYRKVGDAAFGYYVHVGVSLGDALGGMKRGSWQVYL